MPIVNKGWLAKDDGFDAVEILEDCETHRKVKFLEGDRKGEEIMVVPDGQPNGNLYPALFYGEAKPEVWSFRGRSLPIIPLESWPEAVRAQVKALVPPKIDYFFSPENTVQVMDGIIEGDNQLLVGHKGVGKTSLIEQIAARIGMPVIKLSFTGNLSISDLMGTPTLTKSGTSFAYGPVPTAMQRGYWLLCDEFDFGDPSVMSAFHPILEPRSMYTLKENDGEVIIADKLNPAKDRIYGFRVFATGNSLAGDNDGNYSGTQALNSALLDRFSGHGQVIRVKPMKAREERAVLKARIPTLPDRLAKRAVNFASRVRRGEQGQNAVDPILPTFSTRELINFCKKMLRYRDPIKAANLTFLPVIEDANLRAPVEKAVELIFGKRIILGRSTIPTADGGTASLREGKTLADVRSAGNLDAVGRAVLAAKAKGLSWEKIEKDEELAKAGCEALGLRQNNGNTAWRIAKEYKRLLKKAERAEGKAEDADEDAPDAPEADAPEAEDADADEDEELDDDVDTDDEDE